MMKRGTIRTVLGVLFVSTLLTVFATAQSLSNVALIGEAYGAMKQATVDDCAGLTSAFEIDCTGEGASGKLGISVPLASLGLVSGNVYVLSFYAKVADTFDTLTVSFHNADGRRLSGFTYQLGGQWTKLYIPFTAKANDVSVRMMVGGALQKVSIGGIAIEESGTSLVDAKSGYYMVPSPEWETVSIDWDDGLGIGSSMDVVAAGEYIYTVADRKLHVFRAGARGEKPVLVSSTKPYGDLRQMSLTDDGKGIVVTARANGVFVFDISNPEQPVLASRIDAPEMATGIDIQGDFCYIADRVYGVSMFDISDLYNPEIVSSVQVQSGDEAQDCKVYNGYLYVGGWGYCRVTVWDVRDMDNPKFVRHIELKGRGDGVAVKDGILYAATGHMESGATQADRPGYGLGNGMEIFDIADPANPVLLSRVRAEGRLYSAWPDIWRVKVAGDLAYLFSTFNGVYVYDTSDKHLPKRVAHINVVAAKDEPGYLNVKRVPEWVYPFDTAEERWGALVGGDVQDGSLYIASQSKDLYVLNGKDYIAERTDRNDSTVFPSRGEEATYFTNDLEAMGFTNAQLFKPGSQVWASARHGDYTYVAAGLDGIYVIDDAMNVIAHHPSRDITQDIQIHGNKIYTAENGAGLCIYEIDAVQPEKITYLSSYREEGVPIVEVALSPDSRYAFVQRGNTSLLLDVSDSRHPKRYKHFWYTMVYQNQMTRSPIQNRYLILFANGSKTVVCDFGENGSFDTPVITETWTSGIRQENGITADGDQAFVTAGSRIHSFDPGDEVVYTSPLTRNANVQTFGVEGLSGGTPEVVGDYAFITRRSSGELILLKLASERNAPPEILKRVTFKGNPGRLSVIADRIYLPLGYGGLASFDLPKP